MKRLNNISWMHILRGLLFIIVAILIFRQPLASAVALTATIGILTTAAGVIFIIGSIKFRKFYKQWKWTLAFGILDVMLGLLLLFKPVITTPLLVMFIGSWSVGIGMLEIILSFKVKKLGFNKWWTLLLIGLLSLLFGFIIIARPVIGAISISFFMGMQFLIYGSFLMYRGFKINKTEKTEPITV